MKILGFGDSFQNGLTTKHLEYQGSYQQIVGNHYNTFVELKGCPGSGPWDSFFKCLKVLEGKQLPDVIIFGWSEAMRSLYHPLYDSVPKENFIHNNPVHQAAKMYYTYLSDEDKDNHSLKALMLYFDMIALKYPQIKFINLHNFSWLDKTQTYKDYDKIGPKQIKYHHRFENCAEIRPALIYLSRLDGWGWGETENRHCHLTPKMHQLVANAIIDCIDNYSLGKLVDMDIRTVK